MSWDAELIHSWGRRGWQMEKWWASREKRSGVTRLRAERNPPDHFPQLISMHGRSEPQVTRHAEWQHVENIWEYLLSHLDFPFFGMSRCPDSRSLVAHIPHAPGVCRGRVTRSTPEWKWKFGSPHYLQSYHYQPPGSALTKLLTQTCAHSASVPVSWPDKLHSTAHFGKILTPSTGLIFCNNGSHIWNLFNLRFTTGLIRTIC